eukprot:g14106.t1
MQKGVGAECQIDDTGLEMLVRFCLFLEDLTVASFHLSNDGVAFALRSVGADEAVAPEALPDQSSDQHEHVPSSTPSPEVGRTDLTDLGAFCNRHRLSDVVLQQMSDEDRARTKETPAEITNRFELVDLKEEEIDEFCKQLTLGERARLRKGIQELRDSLRESKVPLDPFEKAELNAFKDLQGVASVKIV